MSNFAIDKIVREGDATFGDAGTNAMEEGVRERQIAATEMIDFMVELRYGRCQDQYLMILLQAWKLVVTKDAKAKMMSRCTKTKRDF